MEKFSTEFLKGITERFTEFYLDTFDVEAELKKYRHQFSGKKIICPFNYQVCTREETVYNKNEHFKHDLTGIESVIIRYLVKNAEMLELESVTICGYNPIIGKGVHFNDIDYSKYDIVIDAPPNSYFKSFINLMISENIKFLIVGRKITTIDEEIFFHIKTNKLWVGYHSLLAENSHFGKKNADNEKFFFCCWYTNLFVETRNTILGVRGEKIDFSKPAACTCEDVLFVDDEDLIPTDYAKEMCVRLDILKNFNPKQFNLLRPADCNNIHEILKHNQYARVIISNR